VASFNLGSSDIGRYTLNALDDSGSYAATSVSGSSNTLTVRPFALLVRNLQYGSTNNPNGSAATDSVFAPAGASFSANVAATLWSAAMLSNGADSSNSGTPSGSATAAALTAAGLAPGFASTVTLSPLAASQTPAGGALGSLNNGVVAGSAFSAGSATVSTLQYTEVGSFALNTSAVVTGFLGSALSLDAIVVNASGAQNTRVGRFTTAKFALSGASLLHRSTASCSPASAFTYLGEPFRLGFTLTAQNALGATTTNYTGSYARLDPTVASNWRLAGLAGSTLFSTSGTARLSLGTATGSWASGVTAVTLTASALRASTADGPFDAVFGIAPLDADNVGMASFDLDTDIPANGNDHSSVATVALRHGRLQLLNAIGAQDRPLSLPLSAQHWNGTGFATNTLDSCTRLASSAVNLGNHRKTLTAADTVLSPSSVTLAAGTAVLTLAKPAAGHAGTVDLALSLGTATTDASCLQPWTPTTAATAGASLGHLRGGWCGSTLDKDPTARASFGLFHGADNFIHQREFY